MFVGHYAAALAAKAAEPKAPLWTLVGACQLVDIAWSSFIIAGIEHADVDPSLPGSTLVLHDMPWTHSLPATFAWSLGALLIAKLLLSWRASFFIGLTVASHWLLDFFVHRPDLQLYPGGPSVGLGWWNYPVPEQAVEIGLLAVCGAAWAASRKHLGRFAWPAIAFIAFLVALQIVAMLSPAGTSAGPLPAEAGITVLVVYLAVVAVAVLADRNTKRDNDALDATG